MHTASIILLLSFQILGLVSPSENVPGIYNNTFTNGKIIGGKLVTIEEYPYQLSLQLMGIHICGAAMIGNRWALTAAHCTYGSPAVNLTIRAGTSYYGYEGQVISVKRIHEHPSYNPTTQDSDISVIQLVGPITTRKSAKISLPSWYNFLYPWLHGTITGWGTTKENGSTSWQLRAATVPIINSYSCYMSYGTLLTTNMFCAGRNHKDSCQGDSGGPLVIHGKLYGIVSFGVGCGRPDYPGVYTRVSAFTSFIKGITGI